MYALTYYEYDEDGGGKIGYTLYRVRTDESTVEEVPVDWYRASDSEFRLDVDQFEILANGDFLMSQPFDRGIVQYSGSDGAVREVYNFNNNPSFATNGDTLAILYQGSALIYDGASQELTGEVPLEDQMYVDDYMYYGRCYYGRDDTLYVQSSRGLYRLNSDGILWEKIIDGELCSMSQVRLNFTGLVELENEDFCILAGDERDNSVILKYHYDPDVATLPEHELVVYTLADNATVRLAAVEYQKLYPDTKVSVEVAYSDSSATASDLQRALNTELLNGKGPDILILDGMNAESYIDRGILLDLSGLVSELTARRNMVEPVLRTYEKDGQTCALPVKYHLPVMIAEVSVAADVKTLDDLARYAAEHPERGILGDLRPETLLEALLPASAFTWVTDSAIDTEQLSVFLEAVHTIANTGAESYLYEEEDFFGYTYMEQFHYTFGRSHTYLGQMRGLYDATLLHPLVEPESNFSGFPEPRTDSVITYLPGQQDKSYIPATVTGINVNSAQTEKAVDFVKLLLSDSVQYDGGETTGFAVSVTAQEEEAAIFVDALWPGRLNTHAEGEAIIAPWAPVELQQQVTRLAQGVENPSIMDEVLKAMIIDSAKGYLTGEKSLEQAFTDVEEATRLYLAE